VMWGTDNAVQKLTTDDLSGYQYQYNRPPFNGNPDQGCN
jgi:hypothetical protein